MRSCGPYRAATSATPRKSRGASRRFRRRARRVPPRRGPATLRVALSGDDASDIARHLHYLGRVSAAAARLIAEFRSGQSELDALKQAALERAARLAEIDAAQRRDRERIVAERRSRRRILDSV